MLARTRSLVLERSLLSRGVAAVLTAPVSPAVVPVRGLRQHQKVIKKAADADLIGRLTGRIRLPEPLQGPVVKPEPAQLSASVINVEREVVGQVSLHNEVWDQEIRKDLVKLVVDWQLKKRIILTDHFKTRAEVSGSGKKPHPQKGTGRARQGTKRAPHHRGGGKAFPKVHRSLEYSLNKKVRARGLKIALSAKRAEGNLVVIDKLVSPSHERGAMQPLLEPYRANTSCRVLIVHANDEELDPNFILSTRSLQWVDILPERGVNCYDLVNHSTLFITLRGLAELEQRLSQPQSKIEYVAPDLRFPDGYNLDSDALKPRPPTFTPADGSSPMEVAAPPVALRAWRQLSNVRKLQVVRAQAVDEATEQNKAAQAEAGEGEAGQQLPPFKGTERLPPRFTVDLGETQVDVNVKELAHAIIGKAKRAPAALPTVLPPGLAHRMKKYHNLQKKQEKLQRAAAEAGFMPPEAAGSQGEVAAQ